MNKLLKSIIQLASREPIIAVLWLYGSRAKGRANPQSDYDLAAAFTTFPDDSWSKRLQPELLAMRWADSLGLDTDKLSVVDINHIPLPLAYSIINSGELLMVKDPVRLAREENRITGMWELDHQYHRKRYG